MFFVCLLSLGILLGTPSAGHTAGTAAVLHDTFPGADAAWTTALTAALKEQGMQTITLDGHKAAALKATGADVLVLPHADLYPLAARDSLRDFLKAGGRAVLVGGEPFSRLLWQSEGTWTDEKTAAERLNRTPVAASLLDVDRAAGASWGVSGPGKTTLQVAAEDSGRKEVGRALRFTLKNYEGWANTRVPMPARPFAEGQALTVVWARGDATTPRLSLEWVEEDGSRWIASIALEEGWRRYVLRPEAFSYWHDNKSKGRGGAGDRLNPQKARVLTVGLSNSHAPARPGDHTFWIAGLGTAPAPAGTPNEFDRPLLEGLSPWYKTYTTANVARVRLNADQAILKAAPQWQGLNSLCSPIARTLGTGVYSTRNYRWIPVLEAVDRDGELRGTAASIMLHFGGDYERAAWAYIGTDDARFLANNRESVARLAATLASRLADGLFLTQAGAEHVAYYPGETWNLAAEVGNFGSAPARAEVILTVRDADGKERFRQTAPVAAAPGARPKVTLQFPARALTPGLYTVTTELRRDGKSVDRIRQTVRLTAPRKVDPAQLVTVRDGDFILGGKPWVPFGLNFWPSYCSGTEPFDYWQHWLRPRQYDPEAVDRDLQAMARLRMNVACIQYPDPEMARPLVDFLERCRAYGIKVMIHGPSGHPLTGFNRETCERLIREARLAESDVVFAYDLAWEPRVGRRDARKRLDPAWEAWITERYGSLANAESDWGCPVPREDGKVAGPADSLLLNHGAHNRMVAAYRRFLDDAISQGYGSHIRFLRTLDPHHLMGVRSGYGGNGNPGNDGMIPFDLASGAAHLDFISPEGYNLGPDWERTRRGGFVTAYSRLVSGGKPVFWVEYGRSVHPQPNAAKIAEQAELYVSFARMFHESGANGGAGWWLPGGYRVNEKSDFGIFDPDGTPRPAAIAMRDWTDRVANPRRGKPAVEITVDRDRHPRGFSQMLLDHQDEYLRATGEGKIVGLRTAATGTTSVDCPAVAVGNTPYTGRNPHKYLNAEFESVEVVVGGKWVSAESGKALAVPAGKPVRVRVRARNTGEATWATRAQAADKPGAITLTARGGSNARADLRESAPFGASALLELLLRPGAGETTVTLELEAEGRARFGQQFALVLRAAP